MEPTYIDRMEKFLEEQLNELTPLEAVLYLNLFHLQNKARLKNGGQLPEWFAVKNMTLTDIMCKDSQGIRRLKQSLKDKGLIDYQQGKKGTPTKYRLLDEAGKGVKIRGAKLPPKEGKGVKSTPLNYPLNYPLFEPGAVEPQGAADPLREEENKRDRESKRKTKVFHPPTVEEVRKYVVEKGLSIDPQRFVDYYEAGGWKDSKGQPVKNWKQKALMWGKHSKGGRPAKKEKSSVDADFWRRFDDTSGL